MKREGVRAFLYVTVTALVAACNQQSYGIALSNPGPEQTPSANSSASLPGGSGQGGSGTSSSGTGSSDSSSGSGSNSGSNSNPDPTSSPTPLPSNVDPVCSLSDPSDNGEIVFPTKTDPANTVPSSCLSGFEINNIGTYNNTYTIDATSSAGAQAITLEMDFATYEAPNFLQVFATSTSGVTTTLLNQCQIRTADYGDPTTFPQRPPEDSIRSYRLAVPAGTQSITFKFDPSSPYYVRVLGLCNFNVVAPAGVSTASVAAGYWRLDSSRNVSYCTSSNPDSDGNPQDASCPYSAQSGVVY